MAAVRELAATPATCDVAIAHDYLTQRGGAERVVLALRHAFPEAPIHTTVHDADGTFSSFAGVDIRTSPLQRIGPVRRDPRLALPLLAAAAGRLRVDAEVTVCSTTGWAHGVQATGAKVLYVHNTARWLYQRAEYLAQLPARARYAIAPIAPSLRRWDRRAAATADVVLVNSEVTRARVREHWGIDAEVLRPPPGLALAGPRRPAVGLEPGYLLTVARLLPYKRVDAVIEAVRDLPGSRLVVVGTGPDEQRLRSLAPANVELVGSVDDDTLRWLYANAEALVTAAHDDFGLTPLEAMQFGTPVVAVRDGGFVETVVEGETGVFFDEPTPEAVRQGIVALRADRPHRSAVESRAAEFSLDAFAARIRASAASVRPAPATRTAAA
jgi:glycosyltransferase involved in cell wall biosynthesis